LSSARTSEKEIQDEKISMNDNLFAITASIFKRADQCLLALCLVTMRVLANSACALSLKNHTGVAAVAYNLIIKEIGSELLAFVHPFPT
jgi:hypothetical protein